METGTRADDSGVEGGAPPTAEIVVIAQPAALPPGNGHTNGNGKAALPPGVAETSVNPLEGGTNETAAASSGVPVDEPVEMVAPADTTVKFLFWPWFVIPVLEALIAMLGKVNFLELLASGPGPEEPDPVRKAWNKVKRLVEAAGARGVAPGLVFDQLILGTLKGHLARFGQEQKSFQFPDGKAIVEAVRTYAYGFLWPFKMEDRRNIVDRIRANDRGLLWFGLEDIVRAKIQEREDARRREEELRVAREARLERERAERTRLVEDARMAADLGDLLSAAGLAEVQLTASVMTVEIANKVAARLPEQGDIITSRIAEVVMGKNGGVDVAVGIRFDALANGIAPFLPGKYILGVDRAEGESLEAHTTRVRAALPVGQAVMLQVVNVWQDERGRKRSQIYVQIRTAEELEEFRGLRPSFDPPPRKFTKGERLEGVVKKAMFSGVNVGFRHGSQQQWLFAFKGNIAEGLPPLEVGMRVIGTVVDGHGDREYDFRVEEIVAEAVDEAELARRQAREDQRTMVVHPARVEEIRGYVVETGVPLDEAQQVFLREVAEMA
ncbi:MAG: hypothetical protein AAB633_00055, partial [Patescibacteria group bacterium]